MTKKSILALMVAAGGCLDIVAQADEIQFTTLPETVQTTVIRETHIASPTGVVRVIHDSTGVYAVTVRGTQGDQVVYVNETGTIVQAPATTTTTTVHTAQPAQPVQPVNPQPTLSKLSPLMMRCRRANPDTNYWKRRAIRRSTWITRRARK